MKTGSIKIAFALLATFALNQFASLAQSNLLLNGGFETGSFDGWTATRQEGSSGSLLVVQGNNPPSASGTATKGPSSGDFYAVTDSVQAGSYSLIQSFTVKAGDTLGVSFDLFLNNYAGLVAGQTLDFHEAGGNQQARVDILTGAAGPFDMGPAVVRNLLVGGDSTTGGQPNDYTHYEFNLGTLPAGDYQLRFAEVDVFQLFQMGVDNAQISQVPEPQAWALLLVGLAVLPFARRSRRSGRANAANSASVATNLNCEI